MYKTLLMLVSFSLWHAAMEILCPLVWVICLSLPALSYQCEVLSNQRRGSHNSDILRAIPRDRVDHRRKEMIAPTIYKENVQTQTNEDHSIAKSEALSNQRRSLHNSDVLKAMPIDKQQKNYVRQFINNHRGVLQSKTYERPGYLAVNVHKAHVTTAPLSLNVRWEFMTKIMNDQIQKEKVALGADKQMQEKKLSVDNDRKPEVRAQRSPEKDMTFRENAKREAQVYRGYKDIPTHGFSDSLKRYITLKDKGSKTKEESPTRVKGAIGIRTDNIEENIPIENPYAIFYKVHQSLEDGFNLSPGDAFGSVEDDTKLLKTKSKHLSGNYETKNPNRVMKKFFNFNNRK